MILKSYCSFCLKLINLNITNFILKKARISSFHLLILAVFKVFLFICTELIIHFYGNIQNIWFTESISIKIPLICSNRLDNTTEARTRAHPRCVVHSRSSTTPQKPGCMRILDALFVRALVENPLFLNQPTGSSTTTRRCQCAGL